MGDGSLRAVHPGGALDLDRDPPPVAGALCLCAGRVRVGRFELASFSVLLELPKQEEQTRVTAGYTTLVNVASILGPMLGGWLVGQIGYRGDFAVSGFGRLLAALLFMWLLRAFRPREGTAPNVAPPA